MTSDRKGEAIGIAYSWPENQCLRYKITPGTPSPLNASSVAKQMLAVCKLLEAPEDGLRWKTLLRAIYTEADGSIIFDLAVAPAKSALPSPDVEGK